MEMIRLTHILWDAGIGGIQKLVLDLVKAQVEDNDISVSLIIAKNKGELLPDFLTLPINIHVLNIHSGYDLLPPKYLKLFRLLKNTDVVHLHSFNPWISWVVKWAGCKIVYTEHGNFGFGRTLGRSEEVNHWLQKLFLNQQVDRMVYNSWFTKKEAEKRYGLSKVAGEVIYNGINTLRIRELSQINHQIDGQEDKLFSIGTTTRLAAGKRIETLAVAFASFITRIPASLIIVGDGPEKERILKITALLKISDFVIFTGAVSNPHFHQKEMDLCVYPFYQEAFGLVAIETYALGIPALVMQDGGGITEIVQGILPDDVCEDMDHLVKRMEYYYNHRTQLSLLKPKLMEYAESFHIRHMASKLKTVYANMYKDFDPSALP